MPRKKVTSRTRTRTSTRKKVVRAEADSGTLRRKRASRSQATGSIWKDVGKLKPKELKLSARRPDDLLIFDLTALNLKVAYTGPPRLVRRKAGRPAAIILELPPQHFGEQAFLDATGPEVDSDEDLPETTDDPNVDPTNVPVSNAEPVGALPAARMRMAGPSRLAFTMPNDVDEIGLSYEEILDACREWPMRLSVLAAPDRNREVISRNWLHEVTNNVSWTTAGDLLVEALSGISSQAAASAVKGAGRRIGIRASEMTQDQNPRAVNARLKRTIDDEVERLQRRFAKLRSEEATRLVTAAIATEATAVFAKRASSTDRIVTARFPFLPVVLQPHEPPDSVTALELPYRMIISPISPSNWVHRSDAVIDDEHRAELWHTNLAGSSDENRATPAKIRAIWSPDYGLDNIAETVNSLKPFRMSLDALDREMLVKLMAGFNEKRPFPPGTDYRPRPARSERLMLTSLGALLDVEGSWDPLPSLVGLEQWRHLASLGRDQYVRVVYKGFLFPFGHSASLIKVTERKFEDHGGFGKRIAVLRQRFYIVVREPVRTYTGAGHTHSGRNFPFSSVRILTRETPSLLAPDKIQARAKDVPGNDKLYLGDNALAHRTCFWPMVSTSQNFAFDVMATDISGQNCSFAIPMLFVGVEANEARPSDVRDAYNQETASPRRSANTGGASISFAPLPSDPEAKGDPRLPTQRISFEAGDFSAPPSRPRVYPEMEEAEIGIRAVQRMLSDPKATLTVEYPELYKHKAFGNGNDGEVFLQAVNPFSLVYGDKVKTDSLGAIASPGMDIAGLSRVLGPAADLDKVAANEFNPAQFFKDAKILGGINIADIIGIVSQLALDDAPEMLSRELPDRIEASFNWDTTIDGTDPLGLFVHSAGGKTTKLTMNGVVSSPILDSTATTFESRATLVNFKVNLFGFIIVWFDRLQFETKAGSKSDVLVDLHPTDEAIEFGGPLEFVNELREIIPVDGFSDPPNLDITPSGLTASYSLNLPSIGVGVFTLANVSLGAGFSLPFDSRPMQVRFNFCERERPFSLTVSMFGGGGFFALGIGAEGVKEIEAALEFGAAVSINLGVASGGVEVKAGVYFHWLQESVELSGYVRLHGELSIIGLISASLTFNLQISYLKEGHESLVWGEASLIVEVEVLVFSASVEVHCRREFAGSESDPTFLDLMPDPALWDSYCAAYAKEEAA